MAKELNSATTMLIGATKQTKKAPAATANTTPAAPVIEYKTERTQIVLRKSTKKDLKRIAKKETDGSLNELISRICEDYIRNYEG